MNIKNDLAKLKEAHDAFSAVLDGANWQTRVTQCSPWGDEPIDANLQYFISNYVNGSARLKPEPKTRVKQLDEIPFPCLVRFCDNRDEELISNYCKATNQLRFSCGTLWTVEMLAGKGATYTTDPMRKTWLPFTVEVEE